VESEKYVSSLDAARQLGVAPLTLRQRIRRGEVPVFEDPLDARRRLIRSSDMEVLRQPRPADRCSGQAKVA